jgi:hypothetical protein
LHDLRQSPLAGPSVSAPKYETAEEEKRRLAAAYSQSADTRNQRPQNPPAPYESPEDEKKRIEREERERLFLAGSSNQPAKDEKKDNDDELPPSYQDL